jgi:LysM repeat protein
MVARISGWTVCLVLVLTLPVTACNNEPEQPAAVTSPSPGAPASPSPSPSPEAEVYVVESGDTLSEIAQRFDTTVEAIAEANDMDDPDVLSIGDELIIPPPEPDAPPSEAPSG